MAPKAVPWEDEEKDGEKLIKLLHGYEKLSEEQEEQKESLVVRYVYHPN